ncbi:MAG: beta-L-arabinofuranosidase domain-containing protein [Candidatus Latescibacterota bacterium]
MTGVNTSQWLEAACCALRAGPDAELAACVESTIDLLGRLQREDGYLNSWFIMVQPERRWTNLRDEHELYCAGHLMEAAVAHHAATGSRRFLEMLCRYADHIASVFGTGPGQKRGYPGHEEIELALVKLHHATGQPRYLDLARYFVDERGRQPPHYYDVEARARGEAPGPRPRTYEYNQAHLPVRQQRTAEGHAVRAMYLYAAMTDLARQDGDRELAEASLALWDNVCRRQMYVTGGVGAAHHGERFTQDWDLPEESAYCETCAAIGLVFWNHRLLNLFGDGRFADVLERALYNGVASGVSLSGDRYFYVNPLASLGDHHRQEWFGCACCPPNLARLFASIGQYAYSQGAEAWVHLYEAGNAELEVAGRPVHLRVDTAYPWQGRVEVTVDPGVQADLALNLRLPGWCRRARVRLNGEELEAAPLTRRGYLRLARPWRPLDRVELEMDMPVERVHAHPAVRMANGKAALQRGPVVYCVEGADGHPLPLSRLALAREAGLRVEHRPEVLGGIDVLRGQALCIDDRGWDGILYRAAVPETRVCELTAVPYCVWDNRQPGRMLVWLREV